MAAARIVCTDSVVADPADGRLSGLKRELLVRRKLTLAPMAFVGAKSFHWERANPTPTFSKICRLIR